MALVLQIAWVAVHLLLVQMERFVLLSVAVVLQILHGILLLLVAQDGIAVFPIRISVRIRTKNDTRYKYKCLMGI